MSNDIRWFEIKDGSIFQARDGKWAMRSDVNSALENAKKHFENNKKTRALLEEAKVMRKEHPSKDCRFFADQVYKYLKSNTRTT